MPDDNPERDDDPIENLSVIAEQNIAKRLEDDPNDDNNPHVQKPREIKRKKSAPPPTKNPSSYIAIDATLSAFTSTIVITTLVNNALNLEQELAAKVAAMNALPPFIPLPPVPDSSAANELMKLLSFLQPFFQLLPMVMIGLLFVQLMYQLYCYRQLWKECTRECVERYTPEDRQILKAEFDARAIEIIKTILRVAMLLCILFGCWEAVAAIITVIIIFHLIKAAHTLYTHWKPGEYGTACFKALMELSQAAIMLFSLITCLDMAALTTDKSHLDQASSLTDQGNIIKNEVDPDSAKLMTLFDKFLNITLFATAATLALQWMYALYSYFKSPAEEKNISPAIRAC